MYLLNGCRFVKNRLEKDECIKIRIKGQLFPYVYDFDSECEGLGVHFSGGTWI